MMAVANRVPNYVRQRDGRIKRFAEPEDVPGLMEQFARNYHNLADSVQANPAAHDAATVLTQVHQEFINIHPFLDGNSRMVRLLTGHMALLCGCVPPIIELAERDTYMRAIPQVDAGNEQIAQRVGVQEPAVPLRRPPATLLAGPFVAPTGPATLFFPVRSIALARGSRRRAGTLLQDVPQQPADADDEAEQFHSACLPGALPSGRTAVRSVGYTFFSTGMPVSVSSTRRSAGNSATALSGRSSREKK